MEVKSSASNLNRCPLNQLAQATNTRFRLKGKARLSWNTAALEFTETVVRSCISK